MVTAHTETGVTFLSQASKARLQITRAIGCEHEHRCV